MEYAVLADNSGLAEGKNLNEPARDPEGSTPKCMIQIPTSSSEDVPTLEFFNATRNDYKNLSK